MNRFVTAILIALATVQTEGCTGAGDADESFITAQWTIVRLETNTEISCPAGFETAALHNVPVDLAGTVLGPEVVDLFDCASGHGTSAALPRGPYSSWIEITNGTDVFAKSLPTVVDVTTDDGSFTTQILEDGGYFALAWKLVGGSSGDELSCADVGVTNGIELIATEVSTPTNSASDVFDCEQGSGVTAAYGAATYTISVAALDSDEDTIGTAPDLTDEVIRARNEITDLGLLTIPIAGK